MAGVVAAFPHLAWGKHDHDARFETKRVFRLTRRNAAIPLARAHHATALVNCPERPITT